MQQEDNKLKTIDLFAGAGGLSLGFSLTEKFQILAAAEINPFAQKTYVLNFGADNIKLIKDVYGYDFKKLNHELGGIDVVIGGPPCQGFSNANRQKNHIISQNNSLVKEYFRAIREIKPVAFVMENVSMLSSEKHRFYDSNKDHDVIASLDIPLRDDVLVILDKNYDGLDCLEILNNMECEQYRLADSALQSLNILYKDRNNKARLKSFLDKNHHRLELDINRYLKSDRYDFPILRKILPKLENIDCILDCMDDLGDFIRFQKSFFLIEELKDNEIIFNLVQNPDTGKITAQVKSYSVIDYVKRILGNSYVTRQGVVNSIWFGVPQERKRFIMMGVRSDVGVENLHFPEPEDYKDVSPVTVGQAISDLAKYKMSESVDDVIIPDNNDELTDYEAMMRKGCEKIFNHVGPKNGTLALKRFAALQPGENFHKLDPNLKSNYAEPERTQNSIYLRLNPDKPSGTVTNVRKSMWIHPELNRSVSVREAARLQSFPDKFIFKGGKDAQYQQVGNAVPPLMAKGIAECLLKNIEK